MPRKYLIVAIVVLITICWFSVGFHQGDEHYQIIEFAAWKLGLLEETQLAWEFKEQMRPATQPAIAYLVHKAFGIFGEVNPFHYAFFLRLLSAGMFLSTGILIWRRYSPLLADEQLIRWLALGLLFNWCSVYSGIRFSGENWSGIALALGFLVYPLPNYTDLKHAFISPNNSSTTQCLSAGVLMGLAFLFRYQVAIMVVGFLAWLLLIKREKWQRFSLIILGGLLSLALGSILDRWFYGEWVLAPWNYLRVNLIEGVAATFGSAPWWDYFRLVFERGIPPMSIIYLIATFGFIWRFRRDPLTWMMVPFLLVHFMLSRKDVRFLFPLLPWIPVMIIAALQSLKKAKLVLWQKQGWIHRSIKFVWTVNLLALAVIMFRPMSKIVHASKYIYDTYEEPITVFADGRHIFSYFDLTLNFYQRPGKITIQQAENRADWPPCKTPICLYSEFTRTPNPPDTAKLVYTNRPTWADRLGLKQWLDDIRWWYVYELP